jgi:hypothetical protein
MTNPLPELPDELTPRAVVLPFELSDEHLALYRDTVRAALATDPDGDPEPRRLAALTEVVRLVWIEHVLPIEAALAESERDVAELGRRLHAVQR